MPREMDKDVMVVATDERVLIFEPSTDVSDLDRDRIVLMVVALTSEHVKDDESLIAVLLYLGGKLVLYDAEEVEKLFK